MSDESRTEAQPSYDFTKVPCWNKDGEIKRFEVMNDKFSGRIPVTRLESWRDFANLLECGFFNRSDAQFVFRGHRRADWALMPTLARIQSTTSLRAIWPTCSWNASSWRFAAECETQRW